MLFLVPSCTEFLVVGRVLKMFGDLQALLRMQPLRVVRMCEKYIVIYNIDRVVYNTDMSHLLLLGKFKYTGGPIFKVVLEC